MTQTDNLIKSKGSSRRLMLIRFGKMGSLGWFEHNETHIPRTKPHVVIKTSRGLELGQLVGVSNYRSGNFRSSPEQVEEYFGPTENGQPVVTETGTFVRFATPEDVREQEHLEISAKREGEACKKYAEELNLQMKIVEAEHLFGGERIIIYFTSEGRVDFRELVKRLAKEYQTRIELRQIGSRDEAKLIGDFETCGQECCCKRFLKILAPVNMRMAKLQKATLDPSKISGHCGRLKCCLRYEDSTYLELRANLPNKNALVSTSQGQGRVIDVQTLTQLVVVQFENGDRQAWPVDEIRILDEQQAAAAGQKEEIIEKPVARPTEREIAEVEQAQTEMEDLADRMQEGRELLKAVDQTRASGGQEDEDEFESAEDSDESQDNSQSQQPRQQPNQSENSNSRRNKKKRFRKRRFNKNRDNNNNPNRNNSGPRPDSQNQRPQ